MLAAVTLLSSACGAAAPAAETVPQAANLSALTPIEVEIKTDRTTGYLSPITGNETKDKKIWAWAEQIYQEWKAREDDILANGAASSSKIDRSERDFTENVYGQYSSSTPKAYKTRTLSTLKGFTPKSVELDEYGGWKNEAMRQEAKGYFYVAKINGRWWYIDPLGYPYLASGVCGMTYQYSGSEYQKKVIIEKYGSFEKWAIAATLEVKEIDVNARSVLDNANPYLRDVPGQIPYQDKFGFISGYERKIGGYDTEAKSGSTILLYGMHVFDPDFVTYADELAGTAILADGYYDDPYFIGYATDNEIPVGNGMLTEFISLDIKNTKINYYSYAVAWTFLAHETGKDNPTFLDANKTELKDKFRGMVYDRYFAVVVPAIRKYDDRHLILGTRALNVQRDSEWLNRVSGYWCDVISLNWYKDWTPSADQLENIAKWANKPMIITEFFAKGEDACVGVAEGMTNSLNTTSPVVATQADRGKFYQNYVLRLIESKNVIGWMWFTYTEATPGDGTSKYQNDGFSNTGLYSNDHEIYTDFAEYMAELNRNKYALTQYFDGK